MIKGVTIAAAVLALSVTAASAETVFNGTFKITSATPQCQGNHAGDISNSRFHPKVVSGGGQTDHSEGMTIVYSYGGSGLAGKNGAPLPTGAGFVPVVSTGLGWGGAYSNDPPNHNAFMASVKHVPATITKTTPSLTLTGKIERLNDDPGGTACVVTFIAVYVKDPNS